MTSPSASDRSASGCPLRVAFLNLNAGPHGEYGALLAAAVAAQPGVEVLSIVPDALMKSERARASLEKAEVRAVRLQGRMGRMAGIARVWRHLREFAPDVIHDPVGSGIANILPLRPFLGRIAPVIVTEHNPMVHEGMTAWHHNVARKVSRRYTDLFHVHGPQALADMKSLGVEDDRLRVLRHGAFDEYGPAASAYSRSQPKTILIFGSLRPNKGIDMMPEVFERILAVHPDARLMVTGKRPRRIDGDMAAEMDKGLDRLSQMPSAMVTDEHVPEEDIPRLFGECGVCLLPYRTATQSGVAMIAMSTGTPLVATRVGDLPDIIEDGQTGVMTDPTPESIAQGVLSVFDNPEAAQERPLPPASLPERNALGR